MPLFYYDLASPECYLAAERLGDVIFRLDRGTIEQMREKDASREDSDRIFRPSA